METEPASARTEAEFVAWADEVRCGSVAEMPFVWAIMRSPWVKLHWSLIHDETLDVGFRRSLRSRFSEHGEAGRDFLLSIVSVDPDSAEYPGEAMLALAKMCDPLLNGIAGRAKVRDLALRLTNAERNDGKANAIIALGWVGDATDFDLLSERVRTETSADNSTECRVAAAGALVQLLERHPGEGFRASVENALRLAIEQDRDPLVRDAAAEALQQAHE